MTKRIDKSSKTNEQGQWPQFVIDRETLEHLSPMHKLAAMSAIKDGRWKLAERKDKSNEDSSNKE